MVRSAHGEMHQGDMGITAERSSDDFDVDADGIFSFVAPQQRAAQIATRRRSRALRFRR
ncbi:MAG: hypothetical protein OXG30_09875 [bacterium]|nr:hypothetical protein [bacterium]MCY4135203.1 hypothetical protein [bacterium]